MNISIGDRVRCISGRWYDDVEGLVGTVVTIRGASYDEVGIRFDEEIHYGNGHNLNGFLSREYRRHGYYIGVNDLELVKKSNLGGY